MFDSDVPDSGPGDPSPAADGAVPLDTVPLERLEAQICELAGHLTAATCRFLVLLGDFDARRGWASWDMSSCAAWLSWKCQLTSGTAREHVRVARALRDLPEACGRDAAMTRGARRTRGAPGARSSRRALGTGQHQRDNRRHSQDRARQCDHEKTTSRAPDRQCPVIAEIRSDPARRSAVETLTALGGLPAPAVGLPGFPGNPPDSSAVAVGRLAAVAVTASARAASSATAGAARGDSLGGAGVGSACPDGSRIHNMVPHDHEDFLVRTD